MSSISCVFWPSVCLFGRNVYVRSSAFLFYYWTVWPVFIFWKLILCRVQHLQWFLLFCRLFFVVCLFVVSFNVQKILSLIRSHLFMFVFISISPEDGTLKILLDFMSKTVLPMFLQTIKDQKKKLRKHSHFPKHQK